MKKISEQSNRHKEESTRKTREIAQLRKEQRRQKNAVLTLQAKMNAKEQVLKRKSEEVTALRKSQRGLVFQNKARQAVLKLEQSRSPHHRWENLSHTILHSARNKQLLTQLETELERLVKEREELGRELKRIEDPQRVDKGSEYSNEEDNLKTNIGYLQENIEHVQKAIMEFEDVKDPGHNDTSKIQRIFDSINTIEEAKYLLQKLSDNAIYMTCNSSMIESRMQEHESLLKEAQHESSIQQQLLQYFLSNNSNVQISDLFESLNFDDKLYLNNFNRSLSQKSLVSNGTYDIPRSEALEYPLFTESHGSQSRSSSPNANLET